MSIFKRERDGRMERLLHISQIVAFAQRFCVQETWGNSGQKLEGYSGWRPEETA